jgi:hypothetical protein
MTPQIAQLRTRFHDCNNSQKKDFIDKLSQKLQGNTNADYRKFLNECIANYNTAVRESNIAVSKPTQSIHALGIGFCLYFFLCQLY